eukprot:5615850-Alexandrium_andersonii.AAC.1
MSASLVGSEMCIRDSPGNARWALVLDPIDPGPGQGPKEGHVPDTPVGDCLLYTSDAADDM